MTNRPAFSAFTIAIIITLASLSCGEQKNPSSETPYLSLPESNYLDLTNHIESMDRKNGKNIIGYNENRKYHLQFEQVNGNIVNYFASRNGMKLSMSDWPSGDGWCYACIDFPDGGRDCYSVPCSGNSIQSIAIPNLNLGLDKEEDFQVGLEVIKDYSETIKQLKLKEGLNIVAKKEDSDLELYIDSKDGKILNYAFMRNKVKVPYMVYVQKNTFNNDINCFWCPEPFPPYTDCISVPCPDDLGLPGSNDFVFIN